MEINFIHRPKRVFQYETYVTMDDGGRDVYTWCWLTLGQIGERWDYSKGWYKIRNEHDVLLFTLRWKYVS